MTDHIQAFIDRWNKSGAAERANYQLFLSELCDLLEVPRPDPATPDTTLNTYVFERSVVFHYGDGTTSNGRIDLYKRGSFVLEAKQGAEYPRSSQDAPLSTVVRDQSRRIGRGIGPRGTPTWDDAMHRARGQAEQYVRALPAEEGRPPFIVVADVGHSLELYSEFSRSGGTYVPFPAPGSHRIHIEDLKHGDIRDRLRAVWTDPLSLDPTRRSAQITRDIADRLAKLALALERGGHDPHETAGFLMRCLFTMFAEDVGLLPKSCFSNLLESLKDSPEHFVPMTEELWARMNAGGFSTSLRSDVLRFNGGLFEKATALPLTRDQLLLLIEAAKCDWRDVEPAIFGTLLERALDPTERHKLGAHFTPREYVERLVLPTIINPIRSEWEAVRAAVLVLVGDGKVDKAVATVQSFHGRLVNVRVLDPACGSGNFLYVTLEHLKRIEGEVFDTLDSLGQRQALMELRGVTVDPHQLLGLEVNPRAAAIAELVLWIGTLQWHFRNRGNTPVPEPVIRSFHNIECRDALIEWDSIEQVCDVNGEPVSRWDGRSTMPHPVTGKDVPDESKRVPVVQYVNPRAAIWPEADYVVGNPPFIGASLMRAALGDGYTEAVRSAQADLGASSDFVMYWWNHAAKLVRTGKLRRFGFVSTNSIRQTFNRRVLQEHVKATDPVSILFAIPDHPWVDSADGAAVRIAMTAVASGASDGRLLEVASESDGAHGVATVTFCEYVGKIQADLSIGADVAGAVALRSNEGISCPGVKLHGAGFIVTPEEAAHIGLGTVPGLERHIRGYRNGRDLASRPRGVMVIDLFGLSEAEVRIRFPAVFQWLIERVKPERDQNNRSTYRDNWWIHGEPRSSFRPALSGLSRYIATVETSKHRYFQFLDASILPDNMLVCIAQDDAYVLGVLSSRLHVTWALETGGRLGVGNDPRYNKSRCFETFPFPDTTETAKAAIREVGEQLNAHRKARQSEYPELTITAMYNVLQMLRKGITLSDKDRQIHEMGLVSVLREIHDELDRLVAAAYGWPPDIYEDDILTRLVILNSERAHLESNGKIAWVRPEFQTSNTSNEPQFLDVLQPVSGKKRIATGSSKLVWPIELPAQVSAVKAVLAEARSPTTAEIVARRFSRVSLGKVTPILDTLVALGQARLTPDGRYSGD
ncbi:MAG: SAM-dependent methyltransferase [Verrucomicrobia bacterium]|nr:SAM-dependent methyltransferase [Verrucomicrobiota bacterium]